MAMKTTTGSLVSSMAEVDEAEDSHEHGATAMYMFLRPTRSDKTPGGDNPEEAEDGLGDDGEQQGNCARTQAPRRAVGEDEGTDNIARERLFRQAQQRGRGSPASAGALQHFKHRHAFDARSFGDHLLEDRRLENAGATDPQPDANHDDADQERNAPAPHEERWSPESQLTTSTAALRRGTAPRARRIAGHAERKPRFFACAGPFHGQKDRAAPFAAADADPLDPASNERPAARHPRCRCCHRSGRGRRRRSPCR